MTTERKIQILIADDQELVRLGVKAFLADTEVTVLAEAVTAQSAVALALDKEVDLVLLEVRMPDGDGLTALGRIRLDKPKLPVLLFSAFDNPTSTARAIALGANGFLLKDCSRSEFLSALRTAAKGENIWSKEKLHSASRSLRTPRLASNVEVSLSEREGEVLRQIARGLTNKQIALEMQISYETVKEHVQHIFRKIGLTDRTQSAVWAVRNKVV